MGRSLAIPVRVAGWLSVLWACVALLTGCGGVTCDRFAIKAAWVQQPALLAVSLDTDLPDEASIILSVERCVYYLGDTRPHPLAYFTYKGSVASWRTPQQIVLDQAKWDADLQQTASVTSKEVSHADDQISVSAVFHMDQPSARYGKDNRNVGGRAAKSPGFGSGIVASSEVSL